MVGREFVIDSLALGGYPVDCESYATNAQLMKGWLEETSSTETQKLTALGSRSKVLKSWW